ncbi:MAG TPA: tetratricopeptide repeat protein [Thermoanaerobaculia bacterium]
MGRRRRVAVLLAVLVALVPPASAAADASIELSPEVRRTLVGLQERWNRWLAALYQGNAEASTAAVDELLAATRRLGLRALPDLSRAAAVKAVEAARAGELARARLALDAAERLDPGRPETAFARARVEGRQGEWMGAVGAWLDGWVRLARQPLERRLWLHGSGLFLLATLILAGGLFVGALMAVRGRALFSALARQAGRLLPPPAAAVAAAVALVWPLALPGGLAWLALYWSVLLWSDARRGQRGVLAALWLLVAAAPLAVAAERERLAVELSPPSRAVEELARGRLHGSLFSDLGVLPALLPEDAAVVHLFADVHRRMGQWDQARRHYSDVLEAEPENTAALIDLGTYHFERGDFGGAARYFERATEADPRSGLAFFNLGQAYSKGYLFDEMEATVNRARELAGIEGVSRWMAAREGSAVNADGGLARAAEVRRRLTESWRGPERDGALARLREVRSLLLAFACAVAALGLHLARRRGGEDDGGAAAAGLVAGRWRRAVLPGVPTLVAGGSLGAYAALLLPALLLLLPRAGALGYELPVGAFAGPVTAVAAAVGWLALAAGRVLVAARAEDA